MYHESQYLRPKTQPKRPQSPYPVTTPTGNEVREPEYSVREIPGPTWNEAFQAGFQYGNPWSKDRLTSNEWYDLHYLSRDDWYAKYPNRTPREYEFWAMKARLRQRKMQRPNWLERAVIPNSIRHKVPSFIRAIV